MELPSRIVIKLGTQVVVNTAPLGPALPRLCAVVEEVARLREAGTEVVMVSSGAVGLGREALGLIGTLDLAEKQACAAVGQSILMTLYSDLFRLYRLKVAQVLVTAHDFSDRVRYLNLKSSFEQLLALGVVPIVNENDTVSVAGIRETGAAHSFDDNDKLSALVAGKLGAEILIILTNVEGVFDRNPAENNDARLLSTISTFAELAQVTATGQSALGRGGMTSKLAAAKIASLCGAQTIIGSGLVQAPVTSALSRASGTLISPSEALSDRKRWIGLSSGYEGILVIDLNARRALLEEKKSLLPVGVLEIRGEFERGAVLSIQDEEGNEVGRGLAGHSSVSAGKVRGLRSSDAKPLLFPGEKVEVIHCDNMVLFEEMYAGRET